jgi:hypothetical protein
LIFFKEKSSLFCLPYFVPFRQHTHTLTHSITHSAFYLFTYFGAGGCYWGLNWRPHMLPSQPLYQLEPLCQPVWNQPFLHGHALVAFSVFVISHNALTSIQSKIITPDESPLPMRQSLVYYARPLILEVTGQLLLKWIRLLWIPGFSICAAEASTWVLYCFLKRLGIELSDSCLLSRCSTTQATHSNRPPAKKFIYII